MHTVEQNKAQVLVDALSYIQKFHGDIVVIKYGGSAMTNEVIKHSVLKDIAVLKSVGIKPVIVHGGGNDINGWLKKVDIKSEFKNGLRVTDKETLEVAEMVLSGKINKGLVQHMERIGTHAVGLSGKDGNMITVKKAMPKGDDIGYVGETMDKAQQDALKKAAGIEAAKLVENGMIAGLGTGSTVKFLVDELGRRHQEEGLEFTGVTTSRRTQAQAESYGIKIVDIDDVDHIDVTIDGADEVDKNFNGIKGGGAALLWEKIVATNSNQIVWIVDEPKVVETISKFPRPVEGIA